MPATTTPLTPALLPSRPPGRALRRTITFLSLGVAAYAVIGYAVLPLGTLVLPDMAAGFRLRPGWIYAHVFAAAIALAVGPFQFSTKLRAAHRTLHRVLGRLYLGVGVLIGGLSGLWLSQFAQGGGIARSGFALLAVLWLWTGVRALRSIRAGDVAAHRRWMVRNFALTLAAVMLRIYVPLAMVAGADFHTAYAAIAWLCWIPNLIVAERYLAARVRTLS